MRFTLGILGLAMLTACSFLGKKDDAPANAAENAAAFPVPQAAPSANAAVEGVEPDEVSMPSFAPQYPGSTIKSVVRPGGGGGTHEVRLITKDDAAKIFDFYRDRFAAAGLRKTAEFQSGGTGMLASAGNGRKASIAIAREGDDNMVIVTFSGK